MRESCHVKWLVGLVQAQGSHHTIESAFSQFLSQITSLTARVAALEGLRQQDAVEPQSIHPRVAAAEQNTSGRCRCAAAGGYER